MLRTKDMMSLEFFVFVIESWYPTLKGGEYKQVDWNEQAEQRVFFVIDVGVDLRWPNTTD